MKYAAIFISCALTVLGQTLMKIGGTPSAQGKTGITGLLFAYATSPHIIAGFGLSAIAALFFTYSLSRLDYSFVSLASSAQYLFTILVSLLFFKETINTDRWIGLVFIMIGIFFIFRKGL